MSAWKFSCAPVLSDKDNRGQAVHHLLKADIFSERPVVGMGYGSVVTM